jgi:signal transduction histidine kinase
LVEVNISTSSDKVKIDFTDNGAGISDEISDKLFMPNFTTKSTGMGLGLSITKNIVELSDGEITFETELNVGTTFSLEFPMFTQ